MKYLARYGNVNNLIAGALSGLLIVINALAFAALIFRGPLAPYFSMGFSCVLMGACIVNLCTASFSAFRFGIARPEPAIGAIFAVIFASIASYNLTGPVLFSTLFAILAITSAMVGVVMLLLGNFRLGQVARFLPYPVLGGIIAGTAWLIIKASFPLIVTSYYSLIHFSDYISLLPTLSGIAFIILLFVIRADVSRPLLLPVALLAATLIINLLLKFNHVSAAEAVQIGWLFPTITAAFPIQATDVTHLLQINWDVIIYHIGLLLSLAATMILLLLFNVTALETSVKNKADLDHELKICGLGNLVSGMFGGTVAHLSFAGTLINKHLGATQRFSGIIASVIGLVVLLIYPNLISYLPKPIIGGFLFYIAIKLLLEWLYHGWQKLPYVDYLIVIAILLTIGLWGFLPGIIVGVTIACIVYIIRSAGADTVKYMLTGENYRSNVIRPIHELAWLTQKGKSIQIIKLNSYLFFGSVKRLVDKVIRLIEDDAKKEIRFLVFDFQLVTGVDSSVSFGFIRLLQYVEETKQKIIFTNLSSDLIKQFKQQDVLNDDNQIILFSDLDQGMEWCENLLLKDIPASMKPLTASISSSLTQIIPDEEQRKSFVKHLTRMEVPANTSLFKQGDYVDSLYFIESGEISILLETKDSTLRLSKSGAGTIVGEIGFYLHTPRTATVHTETDCIIYVLTEKALFDLEKFYPEIALNFHKSIVYVLARRVIQTNSALKQLSQ